MTKVEEVKAILSANGMDCYSEGTLERTAREVIEAMRKPTLTMIDAGDQAVAYGPRAPSIDAWGAMIDAALTEKPA